MLDLWVTPDRVVRRKDEDELAMALQVGRFDPPVVAEIESWAALAEDEIAAWASPYRDGWQHWRPDPAWSLPPAPTGYDVRDVSEGAH